MKKRILAIGTHPDDIEIGCGGTLCLLQQKGYEVIHLVITSGEEGSLQKAHNALADQREEEARQSAHILGSSQVIFLHQPDGLTSFSKDLKIQLISLIREIQPEFIFTHSSSDPFPDHQIVHKLTMSAISASSGPWYSSAGNSPHGPEQVFGYEVWSPMSQYQVAISIDSTLHLKLEALEKHKSQIEFVNYVDAVKGLARYRGVMTMTGSHAEVFEVLKSTLVI